ncbi:hypothetical protein MBLNU459_g6178t1 [Dothideomycetes sp. NU459]
MPAPGDQYRDTKVTANPFEEHIPRVNEFTAREIATLQSRLDRQLGPEYISTRPGAGGGKVHYLAAEKVINLANEVFGFNGWSSEIKQVQIDFVDESASSGKITLGLSIIVRVSLKDGTFHEDIGYGHIENCKGKAAAFEKAKKEAATDAMKRALRNFGNVLGNCLYDKDYLARVSKLKVAPSRWDAENLHRHPDFAPIKKESIADAEAAEAAKSAARPPRLPSAQSTKSNGTEYEDEFGGNLFDEVDFSHPDEVRLDISTTDVSMDTPIRQPSNGPVRQQVGRVASMPSLKQPNGANPLQNPQINQQGSRPSGPSGPQKAPNNFNQQNNQGQGRMMPPPNQRTNQVQPGRQQDHDGSRSNSSSASEPMPQGRTSGGNDRQITPPEGINQAPDQVTPQDGPVGFVSFKAKDIKETKDVTQPPAAGLVAIKPFDPHRESPSIRRTQGVDLHSSKPIKRSEIGAPVAPQPALSGPPANSVMGARPNFVNPGLDAGRRIGMPGGMQSPMANRGAYKPPTNLKRALPTDNTAGRPPLADMSNVQQQGDGASEAKKAKIEPAQPQQGNEANGAAAS